MMRSYSMTLALCLAMAACAPSPGTTTTGDWPTAPALNPADYALQDTATLGLSGAELLPEAAAALQAGLGSSEPVEGNYSETLDAYSGDGRGAVVLTLNQLADDSVRTMQHVVEFDLRPDPQVEGRVFAIPSGYGTRQRCYRATDPDAWTNQPCP
ncbi:hypothetical protein [Paracoccus salsus]|uniref:hypothetical protein n=1 Tax=Paracoccus salsus TaxID=2911061 RepID=UPI001F3A11DB|nr:hypothetical protein [Paracoccus salsus]MCF3974760.1 hypothetical protein [Paracoccus salsus]